MSASKSEKKSVEKNFYRVKITELKSGKKVANFRINCKDEDSDTQSETKDGKTFYFKEFDTLVGKIKSLYFWTDTNKDESKQWDCLSIDLIDSDNQLECLTLGMNSSEAEDFLKRLNNVNYQLEVTLKVYTIENDKGYWNNYLVIYQNDEKIVSSFSKENPLPDLKPVTVNGKTIWDKTEKLTALKQIGLDFNKRLNGQHEFEKSESSESTADKKTAGKKK